MSFTKLFEEFLKEDFVISDEGTETKRARDPETKAKIEALYQFDGKGTDAFLEDLKSHRFPVIKYEDMPFSTHDVYITHLNETEDFIYRTKSLNTQIFSPDEIIPKGNIASRPPKDPHTYPIMSQLQADKTGVRSYYQLVNIGSCTRYQGSEVTDKQKLYYIITPDSRISNREWYTVVSRCWTLNSIVIVVIERKKSEPMATFGGKKVKRQMTLVLVGDDADEKTIND